MNYSKLNDLCEKGYSTYSISKELGRSQTTVVYWLKKYNLKTNIKKWETSGKKFCNRCSEIKTLDEFYKRRNKSEPSPYCKPCTNNQTTERHRDFKKKCVEHKGGKCICCGFDSFMSALEFHHLDPEQKDFNMMRVRSTNFNKNPQVKKELDKCVLLCSNCHRGVHSGEVVLPVGF